MEGVDASSLNASLRAVFRSGRTRSYSWRMQQLDAIAKLLRQHQADINHALFTDLGKSPFESFCTEVSVLMNSCQLMKDELKRWMAPQKVSVALPLQPGSASLIAEPLGVVLIFSAWNFPITLSLDPLLGAIAAGNAVVVKPSEVAPAVSSLLSKLIPLYLDSSAVKVVEGGVPESTALLAQRWDKIFYTGSTHVGRIIMTAAAKHLTPVVLELGGKCPAIIDSTADFEVSARRIVSGKWGINCGQACLAPDYILVDEQASERLIEVLTRTLETFFGKDPEKSPHLTRIVNKHHFLRLQELLKDPNAAKAIIHGGQCNEEKLFIHPTIMFNPALDSAVMVEEIFGPILPIISMQSMNDAIEFVNARAKPLALYVFTSDGGLKERMAIETSAGAMVVNDAVVHFGLHSLPFGGVGDSGMGCYHGEHSFKAFSHMKPVLQRAFWGDSAARYPPYTPFKERVLTAIVRFDYLSLVLILLGLKR